MVKKATREWDEVFEQKQAVEAKEKVAEQKAEVASDSGSVPPGSASGEKKKKGRKEPRMIASWRVLRALKSGAQGEVFLVEHDRR